LKGKWLLINGLKKTPVPNNIGFKAQLSQKKEAVSRLNTLLPFFCCVVCYIDGLIEF